MAFGLRIIIFFFVVMHNANAGEQSWENNDWSVNSLDKYVRYITNGDAVYGHQFGFIKTAENCNQDILLLSWSTDEKGLEEFKGSAVEIQLRVGKSEFNVEVPLVLVYQFKPTLTVVSFTSIAAGEELISMLEKGKVIETTIIAPEELVRKFARPSDSFSLNGFTAARLKSKEFCEGGPKELIASDLHG